MEERKSHIGVGQLEHFQVIEELFILGEGVAEGH